MKIKYVGIEVSTINLFASIIYLSLFLMLTIYPVYQNQPFFTQLRPRILIIGILLIAFGITQLLLSFSPDGKVIERYKIIIFIIYTIIVPIILLFGLWLLTIIHSLLNVLYGLLIGLLIFREKKEVKKGIYY